MAIKVFITFWCFLIIHKTGSHDPTTGCVVSWWHRQPSVSPQFDRLVSINASCFIPTFWTPYVMCGFHCSGNAAESWRWHWPSDFKNTWVCVQLGRVAGTPKALLPVGNELLISFPLKSLEEAGIKEVFIVSILELCLRLRLGVTSPNLMLSWSFSQFILMLKAIISRRLSPLVVTAIFIAQASMPS